MVFFLFLAWTANVLMLHIHYYTVHVSVVLAYAITNYLACIYVHFSRLLIFNFFSSVTIFFEADYPLPLCY